MHAPVDEVLSTSRNDHVEPAWQTNAQGKNVAFDHLVAMLPATRAASAFTSTPVT